MTYNPNETGHLWNVHHDYYCEESNYYASASQTVIRHLSWAEFHAEQGDDDMDLNLVFRWDWKSDADYTGNQIHPDDDYYRGYTLYLFFMNQRKGLFRTALVSVCRADEEAVKTYLQARFDHLTKLWLPFTQPDGGGGTDG